MNYKITLLNLFVIAAIYVVSMPLYSKGIADSFPQGRGGKYSITFTKGGGAEVSIYVAKSNDQELDIEIFMAQVGSIIPIKMWQYFKMGVSEGKAVDVMAGYMSGS